MPATPFTSDRLRAWRRAEGDVFRRCPPKEPEQDLSKTVHAHILRPAYLNLGQG